MLPLFFPSTHVGNDSLRRVAIVISSANRSKHLECVGQSGSSLLRTGFGGEMPHGSSHNAFGPSVGLLLRRCELNELNIMNKLIFVGLLVGGIVLIIFGVQATNSFSSDVSRFFHGSPTDKAIWMLIGGIVATVVGLFGTLRGSKRA